MWRSKVIMSPAACQHNMVRKVIFITTLDKYIYIYILLTVSEHNWLVLCIPNICGEI